MTTIAWDTGPPENLPPARYAVGDRVRTPWGAGTIARVYSRDHFGHGRAYNVHHDFSSAPPNFGHEFGEREILPLPQQDPEANCNDGPARGLEQLELFA